MIMELSGLLRDVDALAQAVDQLARPTRGEVMQERVRDLAQRYHAWYDRCVQVLPDDLRARFLAAYEGGQPPQHTIRFFFA